VWDLANVFTVTDLGFQFNYPKDWVYDTSNGIILAETQKDIDDYRSTDKSVAAKGQVITINALLLSDLKAQVGSDPTLDDIADLAVKIGNITETESRVELPVMARRSISFCGKNKQKGRGGIATIWQQGDYVVLATMSAKDMPEMISLSYSWGQVLGSMIPTDALPLNDTPLQVDAGGFQINLPQKWYPKPNNPNVVYELKDDMQSDTFTGDIIAVSAQTLSDAGLTDKSTLDDLVTQNIKAFGLQDPITQEEFIILGQPALTIRGSDSSGKWAMVTQVIVDGNAISMAVGTPNEDKMNEIEPTWIAIMKSVQALNQQS
jgi:hypothetical protein